MAILEIKKYPDPILKEKADEVKEITAEIKKLVEDMAETMEKSEPQGVGLAAPQVGVSKRITVIKTDNGSVAFLNPKISKKSRKKELSQEGCLSLPAIWLDIKRAAEVEVKALDITGKKIKIKASGLLAKIFQHEVDHLDGILIIDRK